MDTRLIDGPIPGPAATPKAHFGLGAASPQRWRKTAYSGGRDAENDSGSAAENGLLSRAGRRERFGQLRLAAFADRGFVGEGRRIRDRAGRETYALAGGEGTCPTVLVPGGVGHTIERAEIVAGLDRPVVIPDRPGFGLSDAHDYRRVDYRPDTTRWLLELTDRLGVEQIDLVGGSMGGFFAIAFAAAYPERVRRLVLSGAPGGVFPRIGLFLQLWGTPASAR